MRLLSTIALAAAPVALVACATAPAPMPGGVRLVAALAGGNEVSPGDPDGSGTATVTVDPARGQLCYTLAVTGIAPAKAAHIHKGSAGTDGPHLVPLDAPSGGQSRGCAPVDGALASDIAAHPSDYYVNVHNADFPGGALRGQLRH